jgi:RNA polymerase sigma factor (sigma-70 family)
LVDKDKFLGLFEPVYDSLWRFILSTARNRQDAKDILSESILLTYSNIGKLRNESSFKSFIFTIAVRERTRFYKNNSKTKLFDNENIPELVGGLNNPEISTELNLLYETLNQLPDKQKEALILFEIHGLAREEIAKLQGTTVLNVKMRLYRARKFLEKL